MSEILAFLRIMQILGRWFMFSTVKYPILPAFIWLETGNGLFLLYIAGWAIVLGMIWHWRRESGKINPVISIENNNQNNVDVYNIEKGEQEKVVNNKSKK